MLHENCTLLGHYAASSGNFLPTFRGNPSVPSSRFKIGPIGCTETSVINYHYSLPNSQEERSSHLLRGGSLKSLKYATCFGLNLGHPQVCQYRYLRKGRYNKNLRGPFFTVTIFIMLKYKIIFYVLTL